LAHDLIVTQNITIDSVIEAPGNWFVPSGSADPEHVAEMREVEVRLRATADALLLGRLTFEAFRGYWPRQRDDASGVSGYLNQVDKYVISSRSRNPGGGERPSCEATSQTRSRRSRAARWRHRGHRQHHARACAQRRRSGRRVPALRVPRGVGPGVARCSKNRPIAASWSSRRLTRPPPASCCCVTTRSAEPRAWRDARWGSGFHRRSSRRAFDSEFWGSQAVVDEEAESEVFYVVGTGPEVRYACVEFNVR
jgi:hypothetical protein